MFEVQCLLLLCFTTLIINAASIKNSLANDSEAQTLSNDFIIDEAGNYRFSFETSNGITRSETGTIIDKGQPNEHIEVKGRYTYINTDGERESVQYIADENGYRLLLPAPVFMPEIALPASVVASLLG